MGLPRAMVAVMVFCRARHTKRGSSWPEFIMYVGKAFLRADFPLPLMRPIEPPGLLSKAPTDTCYHIWVPGWLELPTHPCQGLRHSTPGSRTPTATARAHGRARERSLIVCVWALTLSQPQIPTSKAGIPPGLWTCQGRGTEERGAGERGAGSFGLHL